MWQPVSLHLLSPLRYLANGLFPRTCRIGRRKSSRCAPDSRRTIKTVSPSSRTSRHGLAGRASQSPSTWAVASAQLKDRALSTLNGEGYSGRSNRSETSRQSSRSYASRSSRGSEAARRQVWEAHEPAKRTTHSSQVAHLEEPSQVLKQIGEAPEDDSVEASRQVGPLDV